jgi:16S rRNA G966 N2-methylase RsmD
MTESETKIIKPSLKLLEFSFPDITNKSKLLMTNTGIYSVTGRKGAQFITDKITEHTKNKNITITDGTANNGSDTIVFAQTFDKVNSIEIDKINYDVLTNNISIFDLKNVTVYNNDTLNIISELKQEIIYLDPPWGGPNYKEESTVHLYLGDLEISYFYLKYKDKAKLFVFKVPRNYDFNYFINNVKTNTLSIYPYIDVTKYNMLRFYLIILDPIK